MRRKYGGFILQFTRSDHGGRHIHVYRDDRELGVFDRIDGPIRGRQGSVPSFGTWERGVRRGGKGGSREKAENRKLKPNAVEGGSVIGDGRRKLGGRRSAIPSSLRCTSCCLPSPIFDLLSSDLR